MRQPQRRGSKEGRTTVREVIGACGEGCVSWKRVCACVRDEMQKERLGSACCRLASARLITFTERVFFTARDGKKTVKCN